MIPAPAPPKQPARHALQSRAAAAAGQRSRPARPTAAEGSIMPLVGHGLGILGLEEPPDVLPVLGVVVRAQVEVKAKLEVLEELAPARAGGNELTPGGSELTPAAAQQLPELTAAAGRLERRGQGVDSGGQRSLDSPGGGADVRGGAVSGTIYMCLRIVRRFEPCLATVRVNLVVRSALPIV